MTDIERQSKENYDRALRIIKLLGVDKKALLRGLKDACAQCDKCGPREGKPCMSLRLALDCGCDYTPPEWCRDVSINAQ